MIAIVWLILPGCNMKVKYLPQIEAPYFVKIEFLEKLTHQNDDIVRRRFKNNRVRPDFYVYLKVDNVEDRGEVEIRFYRSVPVTVLQGVGEIEAWMAGVLALLSSRLPHCPLAGLEANRLYDGINPLSALEWLPRLGEILFIVMARSHESPAALNALSRQYTRYVLKKKLNFKYGEPGKYFEYIIFIDRIQGMEAGKYRYTVFLNRRLLAEDRLVIHPRLKKRD